MTPQPTEVKPTGDGDSIPRAVQILHHAGVVAFPTDTVYGVGALLKRQGAIDRLYQIKERDREKPIAVLLGEQNQIDELADAIPEDAYPVLERYWPGPLTVVLKAQSWLPQQVAPTGRVGLRVPDHEFARALLRAAGPMAVTSANLSGSENALTAEQVRRDLEGRIDLILDGGRTPGGMPSTVVDLTDGKLEVLRPGPVSGEEIQALLGS